MPMFELCLQPPPNLHHAHCANSQIPTYTHWPSHPSMVGAPLCAHHTPSPSIFPAPRCCHTCSKSGHIATFGCSCPPLSPTAWSDFTSTPAPEALLLGGWYTHW